MKTGWIFVLVLALFVSTSLRAELPTKKVLTLGTAKKLAAAAEAEAVKRAATVVIAVVDDGGHLILLERLDDTRLQALRLPLERRGLQPSFVAPAKNSKIRSETAE